MVESHEWLAEFKKKIDWYQIMISLVFAIDPNVYFIAPFFLFKFFAKEWWVVEKIEG